MQYLGERKVFKVVEIKEYVDKPQADIGVLQQGLSQMSLDEPNAFQNDSIGSTNPEVDIYKVTVRSKFNIAEDGRSGGSGGSLGQRPLTFLEVGGLKKQIQLLKELVLHPLNAVTNNGMMYTSWVCSCYTP